MILDKVLLLKGLGGLSACAGIGCGGLYLINPDLFKTNNQILANLISKVGLTTCTITSPKCSIGNSGLNIKQGGDKAEKKIKSTPSTSSEGKIKVYKEASSTDYNKGFRFVIEDGDINLTGGSGSTTITKLEQFETYEIKEDGDKWYLIRKFTKPESIKNALGLPDGCNLSTDNGCTDAEITSESIKKINFEGKGTTDPTFLSEKSVKLTVSKENTTDTDFPFGYKFIFKITGDVTIPKAEGNQQITIKVNIDTEFKIKKTENKLTLEKAWTADALAKKAGLTGCDAATKTCTLPTTETLKLYNSSTDKVENGKVEGSQKIKYEENSADHNQGFKFYAENEIALGGNNSSKKIEQKGNSGPTYEIKPHKSGSSTTWYLTKKTTNGGAGG